MHAQKLLGQRRSTVSLYGPAEEIFKYPINKPNINKNMAESTSNGVPTTYLQKHLRK